jgi:hypothetical protein
VSNHTSWEDVKRELKPSMDQWKKEHPWLWRKVRIRLWLRLAIYRVTRIDIG